MTPEQQKEEISKAYVAAVAARCGYALGTWSQDHGGLDVTIGAASVVGAGHLAAPKIDLQLKCTASRERLKKNHVSWQFKTAAEHNRLVRRRHAPLFLVILVLPGEREQWITHSTEDLILRRCAYFQLMTNRDPATAASPTVHVPYANVFSPESLEQLMEQVSKGELP